MNASWRRPFALLLGVAALLAAFASVSYANGTFAAGPGNDKNVASPESPNMTLPDAGTTSTSGNAWSVTNTGTGRAGYFLQANTSSANPALEGRSFSNSATAVGVFGVVTQTTGGATAAGVKGQNYSTGATGYGVYGLHNGGGTGVYGASVGVGGFGVWGRSLATTGGGIGVYGYGSSSKGYAGYFVNNSAYSNSSSINTIAVRGLSSGGTANDLHPSGSWWNAAGEFSGANGIIGAASSAYSATSGDGVIGLAQNGVGVYGSSAHGGTGVQGTGYYSGTNSGTGGSFSGYGTYGEGSYNYGSYEGSYNSGGTYGSYNSGGTYGSYNSGTYGSYNSASYIGVYATGGQWGYYGYASYIGAEGYSTCSSGSCYGLYGYATTASGGSSTNYGVYGNANYIAVRGVGGSYGTYGTGTYGAYGSGGTAGVYGTSSYVGVWGTASCSGTANCWAVYGSASTSGSGSAYAGYFAGTVYASSYTGQAMGTLVDNPSDSSKYIAQAGVVSSEMLGVNSGNVTLDAKGQATVKLPAGIDGAYGNFRYTLTALGASQPNLYIAQKIKGGQFVIAGGQPGAEVSWQVSGVRQDKYALDNPLPASVDKAATADSAGPAKSAAPANAVNEDRAGSQAPVQPKDSSVRPPAPAAAPSNSNQKASPVDSPTTN